MNPSKVTVLLLALTLHSAFCTVTNAKSGADLQSFSAANIKNNHTYGLYFTEKDEGFLSTIKGIFSTDKEAEFKDLLVNSDKMSLLNINVGTKELKDYATQMGITAFPYIVVYFNGERDHNIHGPANKETATQILNEINRTTPKPVSINTTQTAPVAITAKNIPVESKDDHDAHGSPSEALEAKVNPQTGKVENGVVAPGPKPAPATQIKPAAGDKPAPAKPATPQPVPQPTIAKPVAPVAPAQPAPVKPVQPVAQPATKPIAPQPAQPQVAQPQATPSNPQDIRPKQVGTYIHELPRHEPGYIEDVDQDDLLPQNVWARQVLSALPEIVYDVFPEPHPATPIQEVPIQYVVPEVIAAPVYQPASVFVQQQAPIHVQQPVYTVQQPQQVVYEAP